MNKSLENPGTKSRNENFENTGTKITKNLGTKITKNMGTKITKIWEQK
jgi:hypothetical protein